MLEFAEHGRAFDARAGLARRVAVRRLTLAWFRNYAAGTIPLDGRSVVLTGANGSGKTNLLEAVSLLAPGRGLRRATHADLAAADGPGTWAVAARLDDGDGCEIDIGTGITEPAGGEEAGARQVRVDGVAKRSASALGEHVAVSWLTPDLDGIFRGAAGERRRFLDRMVIGTDPAHGARVSSLERLLRSRNRLLEDAADPRWLDATERELAEVAVAVAAARLTFVDALATSIAEHHDAGSPFPDARVALDGAMEASLADMPASLVEDAYRRTLRETRARDASAGRTLDGPHLADLVVRHGPKDAPAERCSTGEQKALLVGLVLAHARLVATVRGATPLLLLDEIAAHLDAIRRAGLVEAIERLGAQAFLTGTDEVMFAALAGRAQFLAVSNGGVRPGGDM